MEILHKGIISKLRDIAWPIKKEEYNLFFPSAIILLCILYNFGALRSIKDSLVVSEIGAEVIGFIKLWLVLPFALLFTVIYFKLCNILEPKKLYFIIVTFFITIFCIFSFVIYPNQDIFHPSENFIKTALINYPHLKWFILLLSKWSYAVFYVFVELWGVIVINLMFWQFANNIFAQEQAKRFYPILNLAGNIGLILAGSILLASSSEHFSISYFNQLSHNSSAQSLQITVLSVLFFGILSIYMLYILDQKNTSITSLQNKQQVNTKTKLSLKDSLLLVFKSSYIRCMALLVMCYGLVLNIIEGPWKAKVNKLYPSTQSYLNFTGQFNIWLGVFGLFNTIVISNLIRRTSWKFSAMTAPIIIGITGILFFTFIISSDYYGHSSSLGNQLLYLAVMIGALQNITSKSIKYSLFDSTKEIAYIPLDVELRTKGKAAADVIGAKFGKSLGSFIQVLTFSIIPHSSFDTIHIALMIVFVIVILIWIWDIGILSTKLEKLLSNEKN